MVCNMKKVTVKKIIPNLDADKNSLLTVIKEYSHDRDKLIKNRSIEALKSDVEKDIKYQHETLEMNIIPNHGSITVIDANSNAIIREFKLEYGEPLEIPYLTDKDTDFTIAIDLETGVVDVPIKQIEDFHSNGIDDEKTIYNEGLVIGLYNRLYALGKLVLIQHNINENNLAAAALDMYSVGDCDGQNLYIYFLSEMHEKNRRYADRINDSIDKAKYIKQQREKHISDGVHPKTATGKALDDYMKKYYDHLKGSSRRTKRDTDRKNIWEKYKYKI